VTEAARQARNATALAECYPAFGARVAALIAALEAQGYRPRIQCAWRSPAEQLEMRRRGTSKVAYGFHNVTGADGQKASLAVDLLDDAEPLAPSMRYCVVLAIEAARVGCTTGLLWGLPRAIARGLEAALEAGDVEAAAAFTKRGWDPCHVEPRFLGVAAARQGQRPGPWPAEGAA
jgi:hypothetical protein